MKTTPENASQGLVTPDNSWVLEVLGKPWRRGASGPDAFDCWGLLQWVYKTQLGLEVGYPSGLDTSSLRAIAKANSEETNSAGWRQIEQPEHLCGVAMCRNRFIRHVGVWIHGDRVLHAMDNANVVLQSRVSLRGVGIQYENLKFYRYESIR